MKKIIITIGIFALSIASVMATETTTFTTTNQYSVKHQRPAMKPDKKAEFDRRLNLTEKQKIKAEQLRKKSHEQIKPLMKELQQKRQAIRDLEKENLIESEKIKKAIKLQSDIDTLEKKIHNLRIKNMKDFEKILTKQQKAELIKMKEEGRRNFEKNHPPVGMFNPFK